MPAASKLFKRQKTAVPALAMPAHCSSLPTAAQAAAASTSPAASSPRDPMALEKEIQRARLPCSSVPLGLRPLDRDIGGVFARDDEGRKVYAICGEIDPPSNIISPDPCEFGQPASSRARHAGSDGNYYHVMDDGSLSWSLAGGRIADAAHPMRRHGVAVETRPAPSYKLGWTPLMHAIDDETLQPRDLRAMIAVLTDEELHQCDALTGHTPLMNAVINGRLDAIDLLCQRNVRFGDIDRKGRSALLHAAAFGQARAALRLLSALHRNADVQLAQAEIQRKDNQGNDCLMLAASRAQLTTLAIFVEHLQFNQNAAADLARALDLSIDKLEHTPPEAPEFAAAMHNYEVLSQWRQRQF
ncbi:MAG: ankyrin repeat domain-containing protein [Janthinobacterium lividum]